MWDTDNLFLNGPFAPWREEGVAFNLEVEGQIPADLNGALYRVGASQHFRPPNVDRYHWFDGDGMVHGVFFREGRAHYRNRYVQTSGLKLEMQEGRAVFGGLVNGSGKEMVLDGSRPPIKNAGNTALTPFNDRLLVFFELELPHEMRPGSLETMGQYDFHGSVAGPVCAHPKVDPDNGDLLFYGVMGNFVTWYRADRDGVLVETHKIDVEAATFIHDFGVTPNYAVFLVSPQRLAFEGALVGQPALVWDAEGMAASRFAVMNRATGQVRWFDADDQFQISHFYNAYEDGQRIVLDAFRSTEVFGPLKSEVDTYGDDGDYNGWFALGSVTMLPTRWELDLGTGAVSERAHSDVFGDFPRINDSLSGRPYRYGYSVTTGGTADWLFDGVAKYDTKLDRTDIMSVDGLTAPSEPCFVAREGATAEDDGWLLSMWWNPATDNSEVIIQDAQDVLGAPIARVKINHRVPVGFHGGWASAVEIEAALTTNNT